MGILGNAYNGCSPTFSTENNMVLEGKASYWKPVLSGVPEDSQIGPLLFILYINDLTNHVDSCEISLYTDDSKLFREISLVTDCQLLLSAE